MTQAFNLSQLANNLNTSGQLDATDGLNGLVANTNLASSGTPSSGTFLRGDRTWATAGLSAASSAEAQAGTSNTVAITPLQLRNGLNASGSAPIYACRAWASLNGTGTISLWGSGNISSVTNLGTGNYRFNFSINMPDTGYACCIGIGQDSQSENNGLWAQRIQAVNVENVQIYTGRPDTGALSEARFLNIAIFR